MILRDRFLTGILAGIGVLIIVALILFFIRRGRIDYVDDRTPEGMLQNYFLAIQREDYQRAYQYLADFPNKPDQLGFQQVFLGGQGEQISRTAVEINETVIDPSTSSAIVQVTLLRGSGDIFDEMVRSRETATLVKQNGQWKIYEAPFPFWGWAWPAPKESYPSSSHPSRSYSWLASDRLVRRYDPSQLVPREQLFVLLRRQA